MPRAELEPTLQQLHSASYAWAMACCGGDRHEAQEVLQITYLKVLEGRARFHGRSQFKTWLFGVIRRTSAERRRRRVIRLGLLGRWGQQELGGSATDNPEHRVVQREQREWIGRCLASLSQRQREVLELVFYHDLTLKEAAEVMRVSIGSARTHYDRGKKALLEALTLEPKT